MRGRVSRRQSSYQINSFTLDEHLSAPEDYGIGGMIASQRVNIATERVDQIEEGATLSDDELEALEYAIAEQDYQSGIFIVAAMLSFVSVQYSRFMKVKTLVRAERALSLSVFFQISGEH